MPRVSIVIPCFNAGPLLAEAVQSALAQTHADLEVVVVDDGSIDDQTLILLDHASWPRTRILRQDNQGPSAARNAGIRAATGDYILPLDADDVIAPSYVEKALVAIQRPGVGIVYCRAAKFGAEEGEWKLPVYDLRELVIDNVIFVTALFRKGDWEQVGGFSEQLRHGVEDYDFWVKLVSLGCGVHQIDEILFRYRIQPASRTSRFQRESREVVATYATIFRNNIDFYAQHAEYLFEHRFGLYHELDYWHQRYGAIDAFLLRHAWARLIGRWMRRVLPRPKE